MRRFLLLLVSVAMAWGLEELVGCELIVVRKKLLLSHPNFCPYTLEERNGAWVLVQPSEPPETWSTHFTTLPWYAYALTLWALSAAQKYFT
ncbi:hypothetical protein M885DRAFT_619391 [Pelagophyceae sp. CCMP2097]|nr:hypothetical protein M885DRAFT_619391 [Pelagophyceae sp. CCMP2097]